MKIHTAISRGCDHKTQCEDFLYNGETKTFIVCAIFDGCSSGINSHFASALFGKIFDNIVKEFADDIDRINNHEEVSKFILYHFSQRLLEIKIFLKLSLLEVQSTIVLMVYNKKFGWCYVVAIGDGFVSVDGQSIIIENNRFSDKEDGKDMPDYIGYDIELLKDREVFNRWFESKKNKYFFENAKDITITSDGIKTFRQAKPSKNGKINEIDFIVNDKKFIGQETMILKKRNILENIYGLVHSDDLSVIRLIVE